MSSKRDNHPMELSRPVPTFCDVCNKIAFGLLLQCSNCKLICHKACQSKILFHCQSDLERTLQSGRQKVRTHYSFRIFHFFRKNLKYAVNRQRNNMTQLKELSIQNRFQIE